MPYGDWDTTFVSYCLDYAGITDEIFPKNSGAYGWFCELEGLDLYYDKKDYEPKAGDIIFFDTDENEKPDRAGF